jgi:neutral ceramidase
MSARTLAVLTAGLLAVPMGAVPAAEPDWKVGLAEVKITPDRPVPMAGYASRNKLSEAVEADLYARAMVLEDRDGHRAAIVTTDLIGFPAAVADPVREHIEQRTGLRREHVLVNSSHTHSGPQVTLKEPKEAAAGEGPRAVEYTRGLQDKVVELVAKAAERLEPARLSWGSGVANFVMNRREFTPNGVILGVNPRGLADRTVPVLRVDGADGKPRAILFGAGTHNTTLGGDNYRICGDYAGFAQEYVREKVPGALPMFMLGCAGDSNPYPRGTMDLARRHGRELADEVVRVLGGKLKPVGGPLRIAFERVDLPLQTSLSREEVKKLAEDKRNPKSYAAGQLLTLLETGAKVPDHYTCPLTVWQFGSDLTLVGLSGEVVVDYVARLEKALGPNRLWVAGYCNDVFGYLPSARVIAEGGYETRGLYSGGPGFFDPRAEEVLVRAVRELAQKAGRKVPE